MLIMRNWIQCASTSCATQIDRRAAHKERSADLRILDPACGSGHFLLYSFDLLLTIYEEAWTAEGLAPKSQLTTRTLLEDYPDLTELRQAAPRLDR